MPKNKFTKIKADDSIAVPRRVGNPGTPRGKYNTSVTDEQLLTAIEQTHGIIPDIAVKVGMTNSAVRIRVNHDPVLLAACEAARESIVLVAESKLFELVYRGDFKAIQFVLRCLGKHRSWSEDVNVNIKTAINIDEAKREVASIFSLTPTEVLEVTDVIAGE